MSIDAPVRPVADGFRIYYRQPPSYDVSADGPLRHGPLGGRPRRSRVLLNWPGLFRPAGGD